MRTEPVITIDLMDTTASDDAAYTAADCMAWSDPERDLHTDTSDERPAWATLEPYGFPLDGSRQFIPDAPVPAFWGYWSDVCSDAAGAFSTPPSLTIDFDQDHTSAGLTLTFSPQTGEWCTRLKVAWYGARGTQLTSATFLPDRPVYFAQRQVSNYRRIVLTFLATNLPGARVKLSHIDFGTEITRRGAGILKATLDETIDPVSDEVQINTLDFTLQDTERVFSLTNGEGWVESLQTRQRVHVGILASGDTYDLGTFYLTDWSCPSPAQAQFSAQDAIGLLDTDPWPGDVYDTTMGAFCAALLAGYSYELDTALDDIPLQGRLTACTRREALQQAAFAAGAVVDCSRGAAIRIYPAPQRPSRMITRAQKLQAGSTVSLTGLVTGVQISSTRYTGGAETVALYSDELEPGTYTITFREAVEPGSVGVTGAELTAVTANQAVLTAAEAGAVQLTGARYQTDTITGSYAPDALPANVAENVLTVDGATLLARTRMDAVAADILRFYEARLEQRFTVIGAGDVRPGDMLMIEATDGAFLRGSVTAISSDLTGGWLSEITVRGQRMDDAAGRVFTGEIYAGEVLL